MQFNDWLYTVFNEARPQGNETLIECPACGPSDSGSPNASVNTFKLKWRCFKCNAGGDALSLVMRTEGCGYQEAARIVDLKRSKAPTIVPEAEIDVSLPSEYQSLYNGPLRGNLTRRLHEYAKSRGWDRQVAKVYKLGYCITGRYRGRIIVPFYENGKLVNFQGRTVLPVSKPGNPKYLGPAIKHTIFNIDNQRRGGICFLHEGPADAIATGGMAKLGKYITYHQLELLQKLKSKIVIWGDKDAKEDDFKLAQQLAKHMTVYLYLDHIAHDAGEATGEETANVLSKAIKLTPLNKIRISAKILSM